MNPFFNLLKDGGTQAIELFITVCVAVATLVTALYYGKNALTKKDLSELEEHAENTHARLRRMDERQDKQEGIEQLAAEAQRIRISVNGVTINGQQMPVTLASVDNVTFLRFELLNESNNRFGTIPCVAVGNNRFQAIIDWGTFIKWWNGGSMLSLYAVRLTIRVWIAFHSEGRLVESRNSYRDMAISGLVRQSDLAYTIEGDV